jgi:hypothetical protein
MDHRRSEEGSGRGNIWSAPAHGNHGGIGIFARDSVQSVAPCHHVSQRATIDDRPDNDGMPNDGTKRFIGYPVDRLLAAFDDGSDAAAAASALRSAGFADRDLTILRGAEGADRLDGSGAANGPIARLQRLVSFTLMDQLPDFTRYEHVVRRGGAVLMVRVRGVERTREVADAVLAHGAHFINHYGRFATEEIERWHGPEPDIPSVMRR